MNNLEYLVLAYTFIWCALFVFLLSIAARLTKLQRQVQQLHEVRKAGK